MTHLAGVRGVPGADHGLVDAPASYADFVVLDRDIMTVPDREILGTAVVATYIGGRAVYEKR